MSEKDTTADALPVLVTDALLTAEPLEAWKGYARQSYSPETLAAYGRDWQRFTAWCTAEGLASLPAVPSTVAAFLAAEHEGRTPEANGKPRSLATLKRRAASIARGHTSANLPNPCDSEAVRRTLGGIGRDKRDASQGEGQKQAPGFNERDAWQLAADLEASTKLKDARDLALLLVGRDLLARASELVSVTVEAIAWDEGDGTAQVRLLRGKTHDEALPQQLGPDAADALRRWLSVSGIQAGPAFQGVTKGKKAKATGIALTRHDVTRIIKERAGEGFSAHSLRVGMAQDLVAADIATAAVLQAGGWKSEGMLVRYTRKIAAKKGAVSRYYARRHK